MAMELLKKLRMDTTKPVHVVGLPLDVVHLFQEVTMMEHLEGKPVAQLLLFVKESTELAYSIPLVMPNIDGNTVFWIFYPKQTGAIKNSDLAQMKSMEHWKVVFDAGFRGQTSASLNENWSGLRVTNAPKAKKDRYDLPQAERVVEGIDFVNRTVTLPTDALDAMAEFPGMADYFYRKSFTYKKEVMIALIEARKPETRQKRLQKVISELKVMIAAGK